VHQIDAVYSKADMDDQNERLQQDIRDLQAVRRVLGGEKDAFRELVSRYTDPLYSLCYRYLGNAEEAEEAVQDVFRKAYRALDSFDPQKRFFTWIYTIAVNHIRSIGRSKERKTKQRSLSYDELASAPADASYDDPDEQAIRNAAGRAIQAALSQVSEKHRRVFVLRHIQDLSGSEVAEILGMPENTVKTHLRRARQELRHILERWGWG
jgi:RNA polymerase sigma-70 factor (ECF subfamily)